MTYGLLISAAVKAIARPEVSNRVRANLRHLIVDEYQDVNPAQEKLIAILAQPPVHLCVVADDDQSIYQWRGSDVSHMLEFRQRYSPATTLTLSVNRRCRPKIIESANAFASTIAPRLSKKMEPHRQAGGPEVHGWAAETDNIEAEKIAETVERLRGQGFRYKDIAVLFRSVRTASPPLIEELKKRDIPFRCAGRTGLFLQPEASALGKLYAFLCGNDWKNERYGESQSVDLDDLDHEFADAFNDGNNIPELRPYLDDWQGMVKDNTAQVNLVRDYYRLLRLIGVHNLDLNDPADSARLGTLARFSEILADFEHVTRRARYVDEQGQQVFRGGQDRGIYFYQRLYNYLQYYSLDAYEDFEGEDTFDLDVVDILTVHQSKGLEWPVVFLPSLVEGRFPSRYAGQSQDWLLPESVFPQAVKKRYEGSETEERRLFYVAITRAKDVAYLSRFRKKTNKFKPSPFLLEVIGADPDLADQPSAAADVHAVCGIRGRVAERLVLGVGFLRRMSAQIPIQFIAGLSAATCGRTRLRSCHPPHSASHCRGHEKQAATSHAWGSREGLRQGVLSPVRQQCRLPQFAGSGEVARRKIPLRLQRRTASSLGNGASL